MKLAQYIRPECFIYDLSEGEREAVLRKMVTVLKEHQCIQNVEEIYAKLMERERIQSTAVGSGIAIPHCFAEEVEDLIITVARSSQGVEFDSFDGKPTNVIFLLLGNKRNHSLHLKALARIARLIKNTQFGEKIAGSSSVQDMLKAFEEEEAKI